MELNPTTVRFALRDQFKRDTRFSGVKIESDESINDNPDRAPWIGIIGDPMVLTPHAGGWKVEPDLIIYCQATSIRSGELAAERAGKLARDVVANLTDNTKQIRDANGSPIAFIRQAEMVPGYPLDRSGETSWFRSEIITLSLEARA